MLTINVPKTCTPEMSQNDALKKCPSSTQNVQNSTQEMSKTVHSRNVPKRCTQNVLNDAQKCLNDALKKCLNDALRNEIQTCTQEVINDALKEVSKRCTQGNVTNVHSRNVLK
ncbi:hypothetical protein AVEN_13063-1 [Araneus ventricosus]|uniref:Uncharacterized protein n=1 Tax=Araneus ventricosus TaxID=182803 RepID=A0A4Y2GQ94_ARAVE|nr:hypothetical protein AVEN_13063-1 [Araneus ventricosus]